VFIQPRIEYWRGTGQGAQRNSTATLLPREFVKDLKVGVTCAGVTDLDRIQPDLGTNAAFNCSPKDGQTDGEFLVRFGRGNLQRCLVAFEGSPPFVGKRKTVLMALVVEMVRCLQSYAKRIAYPPRRG